MELSTVGIIANPISGKDIRRLVAHGSVFDNQEKVRMVRRMLMGLSQTGVGRVVFMPDDYAIVERAGRGCKTTVAMAAIPMEVENRQEDSTRAARWMAEHGVDCMIVLGGDGTSRAAAKGSLEVPLLPVSTGTNNVFPYMVEASVAGLAAGLIATGQVARMNGTFRSCCLEVLREGRPPDLALVDVAVYKDKFIASRAIWDLAKVSQLFLTRCRPDSIGLSALGGQLHTIAPDEPCGLHLSLGSGARIVTAAIAPGLFQSVAVTGERRIAVGESISIADAPCVLALDGEREVEIPAGGRVSIRLSDHGPLVVDVRRTMACAQEQAVFVQSQP